MKIDNQREQSNGAQNGNNPNDFFLHPDQSFETRAIHDGQSPDQWKSGAIVPPIHTGSTFKQEDPEEHSVRIILSIRYKQLFIFSCS